MCTSVAPASGSAHGSVPAHAGASIAHVSASMTHAGASMAHAGASMALIKTDALRALACAARRARRYEDAAVLWRQVLDVAGCPQRIAREATAALAIHHEHRSRNLAAAKAFAQMSLDTGMRPAWNIALRHRLARIERKMTAGGKTGYLYCD
jgi:hypothetical protein